MLSKGYPRASLFPRAFPPCLPSFRYLGKNHYTVHVCRPPRMWRGSDVSNFCMKATSKHLAEISRRNIFEISRRNISSKYLTETSRRNIYLDEDISRDSSLGVYPLSLLSIDRNQPLISDRGGGCVLLYTGCRIFCFWCG